MRSTVKITNLAMLLTFAVVIHFVENLIPLPIPVPGAKIGLANIITLLTLLLYGLRSGLVIAAGRSLLGSLLAGGFMGFGFWLSFVASIVSCTIMALFIPLLRRGNITAVSISIIGAVFHNLTQLTVAAVIMQNAVLFQGYFPLLVLVALPTGLLTGVAAVYLENITRDRLDLLKA
ncbi:MAG: Gx transporter family protein [Dethiobacteria bacterium]